MFILDPAPDSVLIETIRAMANPDKTFRGHPIVGRPCSDLLRIADGRLAEYWLISEAEHRMAQLSAAKAS